MAPPDHRGLSRRTWLAATVAALGGLAAVPVRAASAKPVVPPDDKRVAARTVTLPGASGPLQAYYVRPAVAKGKVPAVLIVHESRGRTDYIEDVARRLAVAGYLALAPDFLSPRGGTPPEADKARAAATGLDTDQVTADAVAALVWLKGRDEGTGKVAARGVAWGGGIVARLAAAAPALDAAVIFYGKPPPERDARHIKAPLQLHYAGLNTKDDAAVPAFEAVLRAGNVPFETYTYDNVAASFHNDTAGGRFNADAAKLAWDRTMTFLKQRLG